MRDGYNITTPHSWKKHWILGPWAGDKMIDLSLTLVVHSFIHACISVIWQLNAVFQASYFCWGQDSEQYWNSSIFLWSLVEGIELLDNGRQSSFIENMGWRRHFPGGACGKESTCQCKRCRLDPWVGKIPWSRKWYPIPVFLPGKSHEQRSLVGYIPWGCKDSDTTEVTEDAHTHGMQGVEECSRRILFCDSPLISTSR